MAPDWQKLMDAYKGKKDALVAEVDCTAEGEPLCQENGVQGFPTIKWGSPDDLKDYEGGRSFDDFESFAKENLKPMCGLQNLDLCSDEKKKEIEKFQKMSDEELEKFITEGDDAIAKLEADFQEFVEGLQKQYEDKNKEKDDKTKELKDQGLGLARSIRASKKKANPDKEL